METFKSDIPLSLAIAAHYGTSFVPEKRGQQVIDDYAATLSADFERLSKSATTDEKRARLQEEFERYRSGYKSKVIAYLSSSSRCMSTMIAGPSNFPVRRQQKRNDIAHKRLTELIEYRERALAAISKAMHPELAPIMAGDDDAVERLTDKIAKAEKLQAVMKAANAAIRKHKKSGYGSAYLAAMVELGITQGQAMKLLEPDFCGRIGFADYELTNNNANIRRMKQRLTSISKAKSLEAVTVETDNGITLEDCPADNRVRLFFPGKPDAAVRTALKSNGFRWAPSLNCWQAYRNSHSIAHAKAVACIS